MADVRSYLIGLALGADNLAAPSSDILFVGTFPFWFDGTNWDRARGDETNGLLVNLGANNDVTITSGAVTVSATDLDIRDLAKTQDSVAIWTNTAKDGSGTAYQPLVDTDGHLQVDVLTGGGTDTPTSPANKYVTSAALAAGGNDDLDTGDLGAVKLAQVDVFGSVAYKALVYTVENGTPSSDPIAVGGHMQGGSWSWKPPHRNYASVSSSAGVDGFRVNVTNLDDSNAADFYATFHTES